MKSWVKRLILGLLILLSVATILPLTSYFFWYRGMLGDIEAGSEIANTALGEIEYAIAGQGTPYLYLHGTPGGYDQTLIGYEVSPELYVNQQIISVSRPGYLRTPLSSGATFEEQADLFAALLDELGIDKVVLFAASGGGYSGVQFALRHPERLHAFVLYAPALGYEPLPESCCGSAGFMVDFPYWAIGGVFVKALAPNLISEFNPDDPKMVEMTKHLVRGAAPSKARLPGIDNDVRQRDFPEIDDWPVGQIGVPTLIMHGNADENSAYEKSVDMVARMPDARLITYEGGDHFIIISRAVEIRGEIRRFVDQVLAR